MTDAERVFVDSNILVYRLAEQSAFHHAACEMLGSLAELGADLCISPQVLREVWAVLSREGAITPRPAAQTLRRAVEQLRGGFTILPDGEGVLERMLDLAEQRDVRGKQIHDANIVATMLRSRVVRLLTNNASDFRRYADLIEVLPML